METRRLEGKWENEEPDTEDPLDTIKREMDPVPGAGFQVAQPQIFQVKIKEEDLGAEGPLLTIKQETDPVTGAGRVPAAILSDFPLLVHLEENVFRRAAQKSTQNGYRVKPEEWGDVRESEDLDGGDMEEEVSPSMLVCQAEHRGNWGDGRGEISIREQYWGSRSEGRRVRRERASGSRDIGDGEWVSGDTGVCVGQRQTMEEGRMGQGQMNKAGIHRSTREGEEQRREGEEQRREGEEQRREEEDPLEGPSAEAGKLGPRFSYEENSALVDCVLERWDELFGAHSHGLTRVRRKQLWQEVADHVSSVGAYHREAAPTYKRFSDVKRRIREKLLVRRKKAQKAGRGPLPPIKLKGYERQLLERIGQELCEGIEAEFLGTDLRRSLCYHSPAFRDMDEPSVGGAVESCEQAEPQEADEMQTPLEPDDELSGTFMEESVPVLNVQQPWGDDAEWAEHCPGRGLADPAPTRVPPEIPGVLDSLQDFFQTIVTQQRRQEIHFRRWMSRVDGHLTNICTAIDNLGDGLQTIAAELREARLEHQATSKTFNNNLLAILGQVIPRQPPQMDRSTGSLEGAIPRPSSAPLPPSSATRARRGRGSHTVRGYKRKRL
ncbi:uncharacterized protein LOC108695522 isoform X2 [Xenopus laevis]|nr:uncharacterized protein LOC108695522 isoform X2 [Xenopus laevis]